MVKTIPCPSCDKPVKLEANPERPGWLIAYCDCGKVKNPVRRAVYEGPDEKHQVSKEAEE